MHNVGLYDECCRRGARHGLGHQAEQPGKLLTIAMTDTTADTTAVTTPPPPALPDRLSVDARSPHHDAEVLKHEIGIRFNDHERHDVEEYCISEGWIRVPAGKSLDRRGQPLLIKLKGKVEAFYR